MVEDPFVEVIRVTVDALEAAGINYAITGSVASGVHGEPVTSLDVDFVVDMDVKQAAFLAKRVHRRFYCSQEHLQQVAREGGMANLIDTQTGLKVDLSVLPSESFHTGVLSRRQRAFFGKDVPSFYTVTPEDIILMKLDWRRDTKSQKQWDNALSVVQVRGVQLDWKYLYERAEAMGLTDDLIALRDEGGV